MKAIVSSTYAGSIDLFSVMKASDEVVVDVKEHFEKQSYRNRMVIYGANGALNLTIPIVRNGKYQVMDQVKIDNSQDWQKLHWRSLTSAYRSSPYFEYYEDKFKGFYENTYETLVVFNEALIEMIVEILGISITRTLSESFVERGELNDFRNLIHPKKEPTSHFKNEEYDQVFEDKCGFLPNLSILDLLFNEGPNAVNLI